MHAEWVISDADIAAVRSLVRGHSEHPFVRERQRRNVDLGVDLSLDKAHGWKCSLACMLSSQQRSGPGSALQQLLLSDPFPLDHSSCREHQRGLAEYARSVFRRAGGIRHVNRRSEWTAGNFNSWFEGANWPRLQAAAAELLGLRCRRPDPQDAQIERKAAAVAEQMKGFGPKQSRNLWQVLGLTRFETPLDSRVTKWMNANVLDEPLSGKGLGDETYYRHIMSAVQGLCSRAGVLPCIFDAAVFAFGSPDWPEDAEVF